MKRVRVIFWPLFLLAVTPLVLAVPAYAADDNTVELTIRSDADLKPSVDKEDVELKQSPTKYLHKATTAVTVDPAPLSGFNLTIHAKDADLVNDKNSSYRIKGMDKDPYGLLLGMNEKTNLWGYRVEEGPGAADRQDKFLHTPGGTNEKPNVIVDTASEHDNAGCKGKNQCTVHVTFGASLDLTKLPAGKYSTEVTYTATAKPAPKPTYTDWTNRTAKTDPSDICRSGDKNSSCLVDLDPSMIPVKYNTETAAWESVADPENTNKPGEWYNYGEKQWANAVTVKNPQEYKGQAKSVKQSDILGFWVYIPRYAYEVMRRDGADKPVKEQNFNIKFENTKTPKKSPQACKTGTGKDYRTECGVSRELPLAGGEVSTWATHPAFTFGTKELNGIWFAKFETTGSVQQPTVLPNEKHINSKTNGVGKIKIRAFYEIAKSLGVKDQANTAGMKLDGVTSNNNNLSRYSSHLVNNTDWGAATYLSASNYGAGYNGVQINGDDVNIRQDNETKYRGSITGCGPAADGSKKRYDGNKVKVYGKKKVKYEPVALGTQSACNINGAQYAYNGTLGRLASTTNNPTGIYDMSGGGNEYVAAAYNENIQQMTEQDYAKLKSDRITIYSVNTKPPYTNLYNFMGFMHCTWVSCGGQALHETHIDGEVIEVNDDARHHTTDDGSQWLKQRGEFVRIAYRGDNVSFSLNTNTWFSRGGGTSGPIVLSAGLFYTGLTDSSVVNGSAFRVALVPALQD